MSESLTVHVRQLNGREHVVTAAPETTIEVLKEKVMAASDVAVARQRLLYRGRELPNHVTLQEAGLENEVVVHMVERMVAPSQNDSGQGAPAAAPPSTGATPGDPGPPPGLEAMLQEGGLGLDAFSGVFSSIVTSVLGARPPGSSAPRDDGEAAAAAGGVAGGATMRHDIPFPGSATADSGAPNSFAAFQVFLRNLNALEHLARPTQMMQVLVPRSPADVPAAAFDPLTEASVHVLSEPRAPDSDAAPSPSVDVGSWASDAGSGDISGVLQELLANASSHLQSRAREAPSQGEAPPQGSTGAQSGAQGAAEPGAASGLSGVLSSYPHFPLSLIALSHLMQQAHATLQRFESSLGETVRSLQGHVVADLLDSHSGRGSTFAATQDSLREVGTLAQRLSGLSVEAAYMSRIFSLALNGRPDVLATGLTPVMLQPPPRASPSASDRSAGTPASPTASSSRGIGDGESRSDAQGGGLDTLDVSVDPAFAFPIPIPRGLSVPSGRMRVDLSSPSGTMEMDSMEIGFGMNALQAAFDGISSQLRNMGGRPEEAGGQPEGSAAATGTPAPDSSRRRATSASPARPGTQSTAPVEGAGTEEEGGDRGAQDTTDGDGVQVEGLPVFSDDTRRGGSRSRRRPPGIPGFPGVGGLDMGGVVIQLDMPSDGGPPTNVRTAPIGPFGALMQDMIVGGGGGRSGGRPSSGTRGIRVSSSTSSRARSQASRGRTQGQQGVSDTATARAASEPPAAAAHAAAPAAQPTAADPSVTAAAGAALVPAPAPAGEQPSSPSAASPARPAQTLDELQSIVTDLGRRFLNECAQQQAELASLSASDREARVQTLAMRYLQRVPELAAEVLPRVSTSVSTLLANLRGEDVPVPSSHAIAVDESDSEAAEASPGAAQAAVTPPRQAGAATTPTIQPQTPAAAPIPAAATASASAAGSAAPRGLSGGLRARPRRPAAARGGDQSGSVPATSAAPASAAGAGAPGVQASAGTNRHGPVRTAAARSGGAEGQGGNPLAGMLQGLLADPNISNMLQSLTQGGDAGGGGGTAAATSGGSGAGAPQRPPAAAGGQSDDAPPMAQMMQSLMSNPNIGNMMQSMMPMVENLLGGEGGGGGRGAGGGQGARARAQAQQQAMQNPAQVLVSELGQDTAREWMTQISRDAMVMERSSDSNQDQSGHSEAYNAGQPPTGGGGLFGL